MGTHSAVYVFFSCLTTPPVSVFFLPHFLFVFSALSAQTLHRVMQEIESETQGAADKLYPTPPPFCLAMRPEFPGGLKSPNLCCQSFHFLSDPCHLPTGCSAHPLAMEPHLFTCPCSFCHTCSQIFQFHDMLKNY